MISVKLLSPPIVSLTPELQGAPVDSPRFVLLLEGLCSAEIQVLAEFVESSARLLPPVAADARSKVLTKIFIELTEEFKRLGIIGPTDGLGRRPQDLKFSSSRKMKRGGK